MVVDDGSTDTTPEALYQSFKLACPEIGEVAIGPGPLRWLRLAPAGKARAMNAALGRLQSEIVVTVDADTRLAPGSIAAIRDAFAADEKLVAATGVLTPICAPNALGQTMQWFQTYEYMRNFLSRYAWMRLDSLVLISGAFAGFRRAAVLEVGGFDPDCLVEDYELIHRLRRFGSDQGRIWHTAIVAGAQALTEAPAPLWPSCVNGGDGLAASCKRNIGIVTWLVTVTMASLVCCTCLSRPQIRCSLFMGSPHLPCWSSTCLSE